MEWINFLWHFINPLPGLTAGIIPAIDVATFILIPWIFLKSFKRALIVYVGFCLTQITWLSQPYIEYGLEVTGLTLIILACIWKKDYWYKIKGWFI